MTWVSDTYVGSMPRGFIGSPPSVRVQRLPDLAARCNNVFLNSGDARELMPILGQTSNTLHFRLIQHQHHKHVVGPFPFAFDSMSAGGAEPESGVEVSVPHNDDERAARVLEFAVSRFDQFAADTLALVLRKH